MFENTFCDFSRFPHLHALRAFARGRGGFGFPPGANRGFFGGGGMPGGRKFSSVDLQLVLLSLLEKQPAHGYELIRTLEEKSAGFYVPSPGVIYPALTYLEEIGYAAVEQDGNRKLYRLTDAGRQHLDANRANADTMLTMLSRIGGRMEQVREAFAGLDDLDPKAADVLHRARRGLKKAMMSAHGCSPQEAQRIAQILERAAADILNIPKKDPSA